MKTKSAKTFMKLPILLMALIYVVHCTPTIAEQTELIDRTMFKEGAILANEPQERMLQGSGGTTTSGSGTATATSGSGTTTPTTTPITTRNNDNSEDTEVRKTPSVINTGPDDEVKTAIVATAIIGLTIILIGLIIMLCMYRRGSLPEYGWEIKD